MENSTTEDSSSDYSTESSEDDGMETAQINGTKIQLPQGLCERQDIFREIFTSEVWNSFSDVHKQHLQTFLPNFPENDELEKTKTLQRLFDFDIFKFYSPLAKFHDHLKAGYFRPDIGRMRKIILKAEKKEAKNKYKSFREQLKHEVLESQAKLINQIRNLPPGVEPKQERRKFTVDYVSHRTKRRYFQTLASIRSKTDDLGCSSDENYPEGPPVSLSKKQKRHLNSIKNNLNNTKEKYFTSTMYEKSNVTIDFEKYIVPSYNPFYVNDESYKNLIYQHKKRKLEHPNDPEIKTKGITLSDIIWRTQLPYNKNMPIITKQPIENKVKIKKLKKEHHISTHRKSPEVNLSHKSKAVDSSNSESDSDSLVDSVVPKSKLIKSRSASQKDITLKIKKETPIPPVEVIQPSTDNPPTSVAVSSTDSPVKTVNSNLTTYDKITPVRVEDLDGIDVMNIPIDLDNSEIDILELSNKPELMQDTHANFFSLIRDVICSTNEHRMNMYMLQERLKSWQENPISPLNDWYSYADNWISILPSAITFLCGNASEQPDDFVPYMEYKVSLDVYQWIGAGRDSDALLSSICTFWLEHRMENKQLSPSKDSEIEVDIIDRSSTPPPPRFPTTWTVRKATPEEIKDFREQERRRYDNPHKAFTYRCNNYESVVGPLKGIYNPAVGNTKARGHTMLSADRPNFVTILSLVRDAAARLPNGEGTRAEICELLKSSQYISSTAPDNLLQSVVSGALDRMHTQWDPCVKYDQKRKIWIYLHRNRTEEDFERIHQQYQGVNKTKKPAKKSPAKPKIKPIAEKPTKPMKVEPSPQLTTLDQQPPTPTQEHVIKPPRRASVTASVSKAITVPSTSHNISSNIITVTSPHRGTSLLLSNNLPKQQQQIVEVTSQQPKVQVQVSNEQQTGVHQEHNEQTKEDKEINEALQAIIQNRVASPTIKTSKNLVKILSPSQGKSLIIPTSNTQLIKQIQEQRSTPTKQMNQVVTQQLLQTIAAQQKQILVQKQSLEGAEGSQEKIKVPVTVQQQILQTINPQQLQNIKNVTLLRARPSPNIGLTPIVSIAPSSSSDQHPNIVTVAVSKQDQLLGQSGVQIKTSGNLTPAQQQQILQTIKQKILPNASVLTNQQQIILKQKGGILSSGLSGTTKVLGQQKLAVTDGTVKSATSQGPVVAKVLTNAAGQVISVESLLAHQKQQGSLPQGTTLRVSSSKGGQQNIIHLTGTSKPNAVTQFAVASQSNILTLTSQPKLVMASPTSTTTSAISAKTTNRLTNKTQTVSKLNAKTNQQLINAKLVTQGLEGQKIVQPKLVLSQQNQLKFAGGKNVTSKPVALNVSTGSTIRMVNAANLNLSSIGGKPVLLASKSGTIQGLQGQNVILQTQSAAPGTSLVLQNSIKNPQQNQSLNQSNLVFTPQMKMQQSQQVVLTTANAKTGQGGSTQQSIVSQGSHIVLGGHPVRLQTSNASNAQRVVLASQGQGGQIVAQQILLPAGFQGTAINIKALQGVKVIPIAQAHGQGKGVQSRQVFARLMNPSLVKQTTQASTVLTDKVTEVTLPSHSGE